MFTQAAAWAIQSERTPFYAIKTKEVGDFI